MDKLDWYRMLNNALAGDKESMEYVKEHQLDMKHHMKNKSSKVKAPKELKEEMPKEEKKTKKKIVKNED